MNENLLKVGLVVVVTKNTSSANEAGTVGTITKMNSTNSFYVQPFGKKPDKMGRWHGRDSVKPYVTKEVCDE